MINPIIKKLNWKSQEEVVVLNSPESFKPILSEWSSFITIKNNLKNIKKINFILIFVTKKSEINSTIIKINKLFEDDVVLWFAYPKGSSKKYKCDFNRDSGWNKLGEFGFEGVRQIAIDEDWSALRFRKTEFISNMIRRKSMAMTSEGKKKTTGK